MRKIVLIAACCAGILARGAEAASVTAYASHARNGNFVTFSCANSQKVRLTVCTPDLIRVEYDSRASGGTFVPLPWDTTWANKGMQRNDLLAAPFNTQTWPPTEFSISDEGAYIKLATSALTVRVQKSPFRVRFYDAGNTKLITGNPDDFGMETRELMTNVHAGEVRFTRLATERLFGLGIERIMFAGWVKTCDITGGAGGEANSPLVYSTGGYGILLLVQGISKDDAYANENWSQYANDGPRIETAPTYFRFSGNVGEYLSYYFINGPTWKDMISRFTGFAGRSPILWKKYYGVHKVFMWQTCGFGDIQSYLNPLKTIRSKKLPLDVVVMDGMANWALAGDDNPDAGWPGYTQLLNGFKENKCVMGGMAAALGGTFKGWGGQCKGTLEDPAKIKTAIDHGFDVAWYDAAYVSYQYSHELRQRWLKARDYDTSKVLVRAGWRTMMGHALPYGHVGDHLGPSRVANVSGHLAKSLVGYEYVGTDLYYGGWNMPGTCLRPLLTFHVIGNAGFDSIPENDTLTRKWHYFRWR